MYTLKPTKMKFKDPISNNYVGINAISDQGANQIIHAFLNQHPELITTVQNNSISIEKLTRTLRQDIMATKLAIGGPLVVDLAEDMQNKDRIYVYIGNESGYTNGNWYYHNGTSWVSGGVYPSARVDTDKTLSVSNIPADARATGQAIDDLSSYYDNEVSTINGLIEILEDSLSTYCQELEVDSEGLVYLINNGERIAGPYGPFAGSGGGGGGGSTNHAQFDMTNNTGWLAKTIANGSSCPVSFTWSSEEDGNSTGPGTLTIKSGGVIKTTMNVDQGDIEIDLALYCSVGRNSLRVSLSDAYDNTRSVNFTITVEELQIDSYFDESQIYDTAVSFAYTLIGGNNLNKTVHFIVDGTELDSITTPTSNRQLTYAIPKQSYGAHSFEVYFDCLISGQTVESNHLNYEIIFVDENGENSIIASSFSTTTATQYTTLNIPYTVYTPSSLTTPITITVNGQTVSTQTVDRTKQTFTYRADNIGILNIIIASETASKTDAEAETESLALYLSSSGRSNNENNPAVWTYTNGNNTISAQFNNFNFSSDGWVLDDDGIPVLRITGDARLTIPYKIFESDFRTTGKTIELEFATKNVMNYNSTILSCYSGGKGLNVTAQKATLTAEQTQISMQYKEDEHIRLSFVVEKKFENRLMFVYVNGIVSGVVQYQDSDDFSQGSPVNITIGSNTCTMDLYCIRIYDNNLTRHQILDNWIADSQNI